jgi:predicted nucleotidyltransferase component of viral defense system
VLRGVWSGVIIGRVFTAQTLQRVATETGHQPGTLEKVLRLLDLLQEIARDPILSERLVLKGRTALNVFHLGLDRLSVDIDLNYIGALDRAAMETERPNVDAALNRLLASQGYSIRRQPDEHAGGKERTALRRKTFKIHVAQTDQSEHDVVSGIALGITFQ